MLVADPHQVELANEYCQFLMLKMSGTTVVGGDCTNGRDYDDDDVSVVCVDVLAGQTSSERMKTSKRHLTWLLNVSRRLSSGCHETPMPLLPRCVHLQVTSLVELAHTRVQRRCQEAWTGLMEEDRFVRVGKFRDGGNESENVCVKDSNTAV